MYRHVLTNITRVAPLWASVLSHAVFWAVTFIPMPMSKTVCIQCSHSKGV